MSKALSLKLQEDIFAETEMITKAAKIPRNTYINRALKYFNRINRKRVLRKQLAKESKMGQDSALEVLHEFEQIDDNLFDW